MFPISSDLRTGSHQSKHDDKLCCRLLFKERSVANPSFRVYYGVASGAVPFQWESRPGTPKHISSTDALPPLTPPPSYFYTPRSKRSMKTCKSSFIRAMLPKLSLSKVHIWPSSSFPSSSSSLSPLSYFSTVGSCEEPEDGPPASTSCFGMGRRAAPVKKALLSLQEKRKTQEAEGTLTSVHFTASSSLVGLPAVSPDLTAATSERTDAAHLHHCTGEVAGELGRVRGVGAHLRVGGASAVQLLVRVQESLVAQQVPVVAAIECGGGRGVERREVVVVAGAGAARLQRRRQRRLNVGVVVDPTAEAGAPGLADGVGTYDTQVLAVNALPGGTEEHVVHHREDISAGDDLLAGAFELGFDGVDDVESAQRVVVGTGGLLTCEAGAKQQKQKKKKKKKKKNKGRGDLEEMPESEAIAEGLTK
ncbi:hypothetical protein BHE74_00034142 [Ensete ventricosum]|nr:hypothetical protein BHE74_00034142 [Ensete ventricosum]